MTDEPGTPRPTDRVRWRRHGEGLEFERAAFFTDAVFAIAMTLLIVAIAVPTLRHTSSLTVPGEMLLDRSKPAGFDQAFASAPSSD